jgi:hypothetical protein
MGAATGQETARCHEGVSLRCAVEANRPNQALRYHLRSGVGLIPDAHDGGDICISTQLKYSPLPWTAIAQGAGLPLGTAQSHVEARRIGASWPLRSHLKGTRNA